MLTEVVDEFARFARAELATGGPDPQIALIERIGRESTTCERVWLAGCYAAHHTVASAVATWQAWRPERLVDLWEDQDDIRAWLQDHWEALPVRPEMRSHRMPEKRAWCLRDFAMYAITRFWDDTYCPWFDELWNTSQREVKYYGRYMAIKYVEMIRRLTGNVLLTSLDIRARHAWSPRRALALMYPEYAYLLEDRENNGAEACGTAEMLATNLVLELEARDVKISYFQLQVLLCEYREWRDWTYYPGASHDEEMTYVARTAADFPEAAELVLSARAELFPHECLGEFGGWVGIRRERYGDL